MEKHKTAKEKRTSSAFSVLRKIIKRSFSEIGKACNPSRRTKKFIGSISNDRKATCEIKVEYGLIDEKVGRSRIRNIIFRFIVYKIEKNSGRSISRIRIVKNNLIGKESKAINIRVLKVEYK